MLDFWGTEIKKISALEIAQTSVNQFDGCEFILNYPELTYQDGVCNPVRLRRYGARSGFIRILTSILSDGVDYVAGLFSAAQGRDVARHLADNRPSINGIYNLSALKTAARNPIQISSPQNLESTNATIVTLEGMVDETINLDQVTVNGASITPSAGAFSYNIATTEGANTITATADMEIRYCARLFDYFGLQRAPVIKDGQVLGTIGYDEMLLRLLNLSEAEDE